MSKSAALAKVRGSELSALLTKVSMRDAQTVQTAMRAAELDSVEHGIRLLAVDDEQLKMLGWTREELRIAIDAKLPSKLAPYYLRMLNDRFCLQFRDGQGEKPSKAAKVVVPIQFNVAQAAAERANAPVINLGGDGK